MKKAWWILGIIAILIIIGISLIGNHNGQNNGINATQQGECSTDGDCVRDSCCHAAGCVALGKALSCKGIMCTQDCVPGTLDCGQGSCKCINNKCGVEIKG